MLHDLFTKEINGKMSGGLNTFASNCRLHNDIIEAMGQQKVILLVMLAASPVFDTVNHKYLFETKSQMGIRETTLHEQVQKLLDRPKATDNNRRRMF